jgi:hypothetical protein
LGPAARKLLRDAPGLVVDPSSTTISSKSVKGLGERGFERLGHELRRVERWAY